MSYLVYLTLLPPLLLGFLLAVWITLPSRKINWLFLISIGIPLGFGLTACLLFLWSTIFNPSFPGYWIIEWLLIVCLAFLLWKNRDTIRKNLPEPRKWSWLDWLCASGFLVVIIIGLVAFCDYTNANPHGRYDAWAIWTVRARMLARGGEHWKSVFVPPVFHADYPLLVPLTIARSWIIAGTESQRIPPAVAGLFTFASAGILTGALFSLGKKKLAWLAGAIFLSTPWVIYFGSLQFADLPLAALMLSAVACLCLAFQQGELANRWFILSGIFSGLATWTKNEGQLFLAVFLVVAGLVVFLVFRKNKPFMQLGSLLMGLLLPAVVVLLFKFTLAPANDVVDTGNLSGTFSQLVSLPRYMEVVHALQEYPKGFGGWAAPVPLVFLLFWLVLKPGINNQNKIPILTLSALLIGQWIGYFLIYVITPHGLQIHVNQSYDRLLMHMYPSFLLLLFLFLPPVEELLKRDLN